MENATKLIDNLELTDEQKALYKDQILRVYASLGNIGINIIENLFGKANKEINRLGSLNYELENGDGGSGRS